MSDLEELSDTSWHASLTLLLLCRCRCGQASNCSPSPLSPRDEGIPGDQGTRTPAHVEGPQVAPPARLSPLFILPPHRLRKHQKKKFTISKR